MRKRRVISKSKTYGFNPWMDQIDAINKIMSESGEKTESVLLRKLVDEALNARREKGQALPLTQESDTEFDGRIQSIESLLMRLVRQGETSLRILDVCVALQQDTLGETHANCRISWEALVMPQLREQGVKPTEGERRLILKLEQGKDYAYGAAQRLKESQENKK